MRTLTFTLAFAAIAHAQEIGNLSFPKTIDQDVTVTDLGKPPSKEIAAQEEILRVAIVGALKEMKIREIAVCLVFHDEEPAELERHLVAKIYVLPKFGNNVQPLMIRIRRSAIADKEPLFLEYVVLHELAHVKNGDLGSSIPGTEDLPEEEKERRVDYTIWKTVGWKRFREMHMCLYFATHKDATFIPEGYLRQIQMWLGIYPQPEK